MKFKVIVETGLIDSPQNHELKAALVLANGYFKSDVTFLRTEVYTTPDIECNGEKWEIKSPLGNGKKTIENNLRAARRQSRNIAIDLNRIKLHQTKAIANIRFYVTNSPNEFGKVIVITKAKNIIEIL